MKRIQLLLLLLLTAWMHAKTQYYPLHGLEIYNPAYNNPAYTGARKLVQADAIRYSNFYNRGLYSTVMATLPGGKNAMGVSFDRAGYFSNFTTYGPLEKSMNNSRLTIAYKRTFKPSGDISIHAGAGINASQLNFLATGTAFDHGFRRSSQLSTTIGTAVDYNNITAGIAAHVPIYGSRYYVDENDELWKESVTNSNYIFHMYGKYESKSNRRVTLDPVFGATCMYESDSASAEWLGYAGGHIQIVDVVGLGITAGSLFSVSATLNILDRAELVLGIYGGVKLFSDGSAPSPVDYGLNFSNKEYIMQLRINL